MQLLAAWKDSLSLLKPANFKLFFLVTLKSLKDTYKVWLKYWGWLVVGFILWKNYVGIVGPQPVTEYLVTGAYHFVMLIIDPLLFRGLTFLGLTLLYVTLYLSCRPSIEQKNYRYFFGYFKHFLYVALLFLTLPYINYVFKLGMRTAGSGLDTISAAVIIYSLGLIGVIVLGWFSALFILFLLDSDGSFKNVFESAVRSMKMVVYNFPFCFLLALGLLIIYAGFYALILFNEYYLPMRIFPDAKAFFDYQITSRLIEDNIKMIADLLLALPIIACFTTNFYIKKIHDQFNLYFETK